MADTASIIAAVASVGACLVAGYGVAETRRISKKAWHREHLPPRLERLQAAVRKMQETTWKPDTDTAPAMDELLAAKADFARYVTDRDTRNALDELESYAVEVAWNLLGNPPTPQERLQMAPQLARLLSHVVAAYDRHVG